MGLHLWRSERADGLLGPLAGLLATPPDDPFTREVVAVPTAGIERWLAQELSLRLGTAGDPAPGDPATAPMVGDGVCANVDFPFPGRVVDSVLAAAADLDDDGDVWRPQRLVWPLLTLARDTAGDGDDLWGPARRHLDSPGDGRRFSAARRIADLFDRYAIHRPEMVRAWAQGRDVGPDLGPVPAAHAWQPRLWRRLRAEVGLPGTAERLDEATARLSAGEVDLDLPARLSVFGLTALPASYLRVLAALAATREVHLFLLHPSPALWEEVDRTVVDAPRPLRRPREDDATRDAPRNPLLASWGRDAREMQVVFHDLGAPAAGHHPPPGTSPAGGGDAGVSLLRRLQDDIRADRAPAGAPVGGAADARPVLDPRDRSLQVHACHGRMRQVQVLRDAILHLLATHEDLEPRDIVVLCPDVESFAPLVDAAFGAEAEVSDDAGDGVPSLRVRLADRSLRQTNPVLTVLAELLDLADARLTSAEVLDLLGRAPVRRRFGFDDDDLERIESWVPDLGIRWGLDEDDRARYGLDGVDANTWRFGLRRLLAGVAVADEDLRLVADTVPYDDVEGGDVELAGRLTECLARLERACERLREPRPLSAWRDLLVEVMDGLTAVAPAEAWQRGQLHRVLEEVVDQARPGDDAHGPSADASELHLAEVRVLLADRLRGRPSRANHRTGDLTVSTLVPMRAVPHRVVCLLGMDDAAFPRRTVADGDDLVDLAPFVGDRDPRTEDRQLLLDALLAATDHLVATYAGRDERTNEPLPAAVPIGELLDAAESTVRPAGAGTVRDQLVTEHPLQPFDPDNYRPGVLRADGPWSFDEVGLAGARARTARPLPPRALLREPLEPPEEDRQVVDLGLLIRFLEHPTRVFLGERLGVWFPTDGEGLAEGIPLDLTGLPQWQVGDRLLSALLAGHTRADWERVERARGTLPPGPLGQRVLDEVCPTVEAILDATTEHVGTGAARPVDVDVALPDGRRLVGTVPGTVGEAIPHVSYSRLSARSRLAAYARLVALSAQEPERPWRAVLVGRPATKSVKPVGWCTIGPLGTVTDDEDAATPDPAADAAAREADARARLATLLDLYDRGMRAPAPLYTTTSAALADADRRGRPPTSASYAWETTWKYPNEDLDPCHVAVLGRVLTLDELLAEPAAPDETGEDWPACEQRVVAWARRLWDPIVAIERGGRQ